MQCNFVKEIKRYFIKCYMVEIECFYFYVFNVVYLLKVQLIVYWYGGGDSVFEIKFVLLCVFCMIKVIFMM